MTFAERLRQLREQAGMTQEALTEKSGVNLWTLRGYEQGRREPNWKAFLTLLKALGAKASDFEGCEESTPEKAAPRGRPRRKQGG